MYQYQCVDILMSKISIEQSIKFTDISYKLRSDIISVH